MDLERSAADTVWRWFAPQLRRRSVGLILPREQLKLPLYLFFVTLGFGALFALQSYLAFGRLYAMTLSIAPASFEELIGDQLGDFAIVTSVIAVTFMAVMLTVSVAFLHRLMGPTIALRRQIRQLRRGNYGARVEMRKTEVMFSELSQELNDLAGTLERRERERVRATAHRSPWPATSGLERGNRLPEGQQVVEAR